MNEKHETIACCHLIDFIQPGRMATQRVSSPPFLPIARSSLKRKDRRLDVQSENHNGRCCCKHANADEKTHFAVYSLCLDASFARLIRQIVIGDARHFDDLAKRAVRRPIFAIEDAAF